MANRMDRDEENDPYEDDEYSEQSENDTKTPNEELLKEILSPEALEILSQIQQQNHHCLVAPSINPNKLPQSTYIELPVRNSLYSDKEYWDDRFRTEDVRNWLVTYEEVKDQLAPFLSFQSRILMIGCGNSTFSEELYDAGYQCICNLDYSEIVIDAMRTKYGQSRPKMTWVVRSP
jgi:2-polyprenyl-3-methyl-5-hydroxy-6-metoxy-1,4-benzoquinol methylase